MTTFKIGDRVTIHQKPENFETTAWVPSMDKNIGKPGIVRQISLSRPPHISHYRIRHDDEFKTWWYPETALVPQKPKRRL